jgi:hypothetical protein
MHDLAVDAIKTVTDEKKSPCDPPLDLHRFDDGGAECGSDFSWARDLISRGARPICQTLVGLLGRWAISSGEPPEEPNFQTQMVRPTPPLQLTLTYPT